MDKIKDAKKDDVRTLLTVKMSNKAEDWSEKSENRDLAVEGPVNVVKVSESSSLARMPLLI